MHVKHVLMSVWSAKGVCVRVAGASITQHPELFGAAVAESSSLTCRLRPT
jgi:hypothetical protein